VELTIVISSKVQSKSLTSGGRKCFSKYLTSCDITPFGLKSWSFKIILSYKYFPLKGSCGLCYFTTEYFKRELGES